MKIDDYGSSLVLRTFCFKVDKHVNIKDITEFFNFMKVQGKLNVTYFHKWSRKKSL